MGSFSDTKGVILVGNNNDRLAFLWVGAALSGYYPPEVILAHLPPREAFPQSLRPLVDLIRERARTGESPSLGDIPPALMDMASETIEAHLRVGGLLPDYYKGLMASHRTTLIQENAQKLVHLAARGEDIIPVLKSLQDIVLEGDSSLRSHTVEEVFQGYLDSLGNGSLGPLFRTGLAPLDNILDILPGYLITLGARTSAGKTALAIQMARRAAMEGVPVVYYSTEMTPEQIMLRLLAQAAGVSLRTLFRREFSRDELERINAAQYVRGLPIQVVHTTSPGEILGDVARRLYRGESKFVVVDFVQDLSFPPGDHYRLLIGQFAKSLKDLALQLNGAALITAQLNRESVRERSPSPPALHHLKESGNLEESSDVVLLLWRKPAPDGTYSSEGELIVAKNRNGPLASIPLIFGGETGRFVVP